MRRAHRPGGENHITGFDGKFFSAVFIDTIDGGNRFFAGIQPYCNGVGLQRHSPGNQVGQEHRSQVVLGADSAGEGVAGGAVDTLGAFRPVVVDGQRQVERVQLQCFCRMAYFLRDVRQRGQILWEGSAARRFGRIGAGFAGNVQQALRLTVKGLQIAVAIGPGRAGVAHDLASRLKIAFPETKGDPAVKHRRPAHAMVAAHHILIAPGQHPQRAVHRVVRGEVDRAVQSPVFRTAGHPIAPLQHQHPHAGVHQRFGGHAAPKAAADDEGIVRCVGY